MQLCNIALMCHFALDVIYMLDQTLENLERVRMTASRVFCWNEGRGWRQLRRSCAASLQTNRDSVWMDGRFSNRNVLGKAGEKVDGLVSSNL